MFCLLSLLLAFINTVPSIASESDHFPTLFGSRTMDGLRLDETGLERQDTAVEWASSAKSRVGKITSSHSGRRRMFSRPVHLWLSELGSRSMPVNSVVRGISLK